MMLTLTLLSMLHAAPAADSVPGTWQIKGDADGNPVEVVCTIAQADTKLSGSCAVQGNSFPLTGEVKDGTITFQHPAGDYEGNAVSIAYSGTLTSPREMKGTLTVNPFGVGGAFTATASAPRP